MTKLHSHGDRIRNGRRMDHDIIILHFNETVSILSAILSLLQGVRSHSYNLQKVKLLKTALPFFL